MNPIFLSIEKSLIAFALAISFDVIALTFQRRFLTDRRLSTVQAMILPVLLLAGLAAVYAPWPGPWSVLASDALLRHSAVFLYLSGAIVYLEMRSLLSRGYSLRILLDLASMGGQADVASLKTSYGG